MTSLAELHIVSSYFLNSVCNLWINADWNCCGCPFSTSATIDWIRGRHLTKEKKAISASKIFFHAKCYFYSTTPLIVTYYLTPPVQMVKSIKNNKRMIIWKEQYRNFPGGPVAKTAHTNAGALGSSLGQGTRYHMPQLRVHMPQLKIPCAATKTWCSQINKYIFKSSITVTSARVVKRNVQRGANKELLRYGSFLFLSLGGGYFIVILNMYSYMLFCAFLFYMKQSLKKKKQILLE